MNAIESARHLSASKSQQAVADAAIAWNRARLVRIAPASEVKFLHIKAQLRKACAAADPASVVIDLVPIPRKSLGGGARGGGVSFSLRKIPGGK